MIFAPFKNVAQRISAQEALRQQIGGKPFVNGASDARRAHDTAYKRLTADDMLSVETAAERLKMTTDEYMEMAERKDALAFEMSDHRTAVVPSWAIHTQTGTVNRMVVETAKHYNYWRADDEGASFLRFVDTTHATFDTRLMQEMPLSEKFRQRMMAAGTGSAAGSAMGNMAIGITAPLAGVFQEINDPQSENGQSVLAQIRSRLDCTYRPLLWPTPGVKF